MPRYEYRVVWVRECGTRRVKRYTYRKNAERWVTLLGPTPWDAFPEFAGRDPDEHYCCRGGDFGHGDYCNCGGVTIREQFLEPRANYEPIRSVSIERRVVGDWEAA